MNPNGKKQRKLKGLNRYELHHDGHTPKSEAKIRRAGWSRDRTKSSNYRHAQAA